MTPSTPSSAPSRRTASGARRRSGSSDHDRKLLVANSYEFAGTPGNATVIDLTDPAKPAFLQTIKTGDFPRNITVSPDGRSMLLTVFLEDQLMLPSP